MIFRRELRQPKIALCNPTDRDEDVVSYRRLRGFEQGPLAPSGDEIRPGRSPIGFTVDIRRFDAVRRAAPQPPALEEQDYLVIVGKIIDHVREMGGWPGGLAAKLWRMDREPRCHRWGYGVPAAEHGQRAPQPVGFCPVRGSSTSYALPVGGPNWFDGVGYAQLCQGQGCPFAHGLVWAGQHVDQRGSAPRVSQLLEDFDAGQLTEARQRRHKPSHRRHDLPADSYEFGLSFVGIAGVAQAVEAANNVLNIRTHSGKRPTRLGLVGSTMESVKGGRLWAVAFVAPGARGPLRFPAGRAGSTPARKVSDLGPRASGPGAAKVRKAVRPVLDVRSGSHAVSHSGRGNGPPGDPGKGR